MEDDIILDLFSDQMESLSMDMEELEKTESVESQEINDDEISFREFVLMAMNSNESSETYQEVVVNNFDSFDTPLNNCSAFTISCLLIWIHL